jgi:hypothetical protein
MKKLIIIFCLYALTIDLFSQENILDKKITVEFSNIKLQEALKQLNKKFNHIISYRNEMIPNKKLNFKSASIPLREVLDNMFRDTRIKYSLYGKQIILQIDKKEMKDKKEINEKKETKDNKQPSEKKTKEKVSVLIIIPDEQDSDIPDSGDVQEDFQKYPEKISLNRYYSAPVFALNNSKSDNTLSYYFKEVQVNENDNSFVEYQKSLDNEISADPLALANNHTIYFTIGSKTNTGIFVSTTGMDIKTEFIISMNYGYWIRDEWMLFLKAGALGSNAIVSVNNISTNITATAQIGMMYYPLFLSLGSWVKYYIGAGMGTYIRTSTGVTGLITTTTKFESVFGGQFYTGFDIFPMDWFKLGPQVSYHKVKNFKTLTSTSEDINGFELGVAFGFVL